VIQYGTSCIWAEFKNDMAFSDHPGFTRHNSSSSGGGRYELLRKQSEFNIRNPDISAINEAMMNI
jgi:hypothetical protein